jgi:hypothetical protein
MMGMMGRSNDPAAMMQTVGQASGFVGAIGIALLVAGLLGWQGLSKKNWPGLGDALTAGEKLDRNEHTFAKRKA